MRYPYRKREKGISDYPTDSKWLDDFEQAEGYKIYDPDMQTGIDQTLALERGSTVHDDAPDADEAAIWFLQKQGRQERFTPRFGHRHTPKNSW